MLKHLRTRDNVAHSRINHIKCCRAIRISSPSQEKSWNWLRKQGGIISLLSDFLQPNDVTLELDLDGEWKLFYSGADPSMSAQAGVGILASPRFSDCVSDWIPLRSRDCMLKLKVLVRSSCLLQVYTPNATNEYRIIVDEVNDALLRVSPTESTVLMGDFNAHVVTDTDTWKGMIGKHGVTGLKENVKYLLQLCRNNGLRIMNTFSSTERFTSIHGID